MMCLILWMVSGVIVQYLVDVTLTKKGYSEIGKLLVSLVVGGPILLIFALYWTAVDKESKIKGWHKKKIRF